MKNFLLIQMILISVCLYAQNEHTAEIPFSELKIRKALSPVSGNFTAVAPQHSECITEGARNEVKANIARNKEMILRQNGKPLTRSGMGNTPIFVLPIKAKAGFDDYGFYTVNFLVDHNSTPGGNLLDYNCGNRTYDWSTGNHRGTDYILWPYPWKRMQEEVMEIVAAAAGTIIDKRDGHPDLNCANNGNPNWNGIVLQHSDGSQTWYWHFKSGAITAKNIGDTVAEGEYLGAAGSSGSSNWPHLHFEVYDAQGNLIDPYAGSCNNMNAASWWESQPNYFVPTINRISTHSSTTLDETCPNVENTYEELNFDPGDLLVLRLFFRDIQHLATTDIKIINPNGVEIYDWSWQQNWGQDYATAHALWQFNVTSSWVTGVYTVEAVFGGNTYQTIFGVGTTLGTGSNELAEVTLYPNPVLDVLTINAKEEMDQIMLFDVRGRKVIEDNKKQMNASINMNLLETGIYFVKISSEGKFFTHKIIKK